MVSRNRRFPHTTTRWRQVGTDGKTYHCTMSYYTAVHRDPQSVLFYLLIEGEDGYRRELRGDDKVRPVMERIWLASGRDKNGHKLCACGKVIWTRGASECSRCVTGSA